MKDLKQLPCQFEILEQYDSNRFFKGKIKVQHDKENLNGSYFDLEDIKRCAEKSLRLTPILGSVVYDGEIGDYRLNGHDMEMEITDKDDEFKVSLKHIERIYGFVPHDAEISYEYDEVNDKTYLVTYGILWKDYLDEVSNILERNGNQTDISMEISVDRYSYNDSDNLMHIHDYDFTGITLIGVPPAMKGANMQFSSIENGMEELIKVYNQEKEEVEVEEVVQVEETPVNDFEETEVQIQDEVNEVSVDGSDEVVVEQEVEVDENFKAQYEELKAQYETLQNELAELKSIHESVSNEFEKAKVQLEGMADYQELKEFKEKYDREAYVQEVEEICEMFDVAEDKIATFKEQTLNYELTLEQFKKEVAYIFAMEMKNVKKDVKVDEGVKVFKKVEPSFKPYGKLFD